MASSTCFSLSALPLLLGLVGCIADERLVLYTAATTLDASAPLDDLGPRDDLSAPDSSGDLSDEDASGEARFLEREGLIVIEAEHYDDAEQGVMAAREQSWFVERWRQGDSSSGEHVIALPNAGVSTELKLSGPRLHYAIELAAPGELYVWVRLYSETGNDNSVHVGLNGEAASLTRWGMRLPPSQRKQWAWTTMQSDDMGQERVVIKVEEARRARLDVWMREDGVRLDKIVLARDAEFVPVGQGPEETPRVK